MNKKVLHLMIALTICLSVTHRAYAHVPSVAPSPPVLAATDLAQQIATKPSVISNAGLDSQRDSLVNTPHQPTDNWRSVDELVNYAAYTIDYFWQLQFQQANIPYTPPQIFGYYVEPVQLGCGPTLMGNASYCRLDHSISYDYYFLEKQWQEHGDFAPVTIIAHEWGHLVQAHFNLLDYQLAELQADCLAGAYAQAAGQWGLLEQGDLEEGAGSLYKAGNPNTPWFDHGTPEQRVQAFEYGLHYGIAPCFQSYSVAGPGVPGANNFSGKVHTVHLPLVAK